MKIVVTYEATDIQRLIRQDLTRQGIVATDADIKFAKNQAVVSVEVTPDDSPTSIEDIVGSTEHVAARVPTPSTPPPPPTSKLEAIDGGNASVDMTDIFRASQKIASTTEGKFPVPQHAMLDGESSEWPGEKT